MEFLEVVGWAKFQSVTRKRPEWIKLHKSLLSNRDMEALSDRAWRFLVSLWLFRAELGHNLPSDPGHLCIHTGLRNHSTTIQHIRLFVKLGFLRYSEHENSPSERETERETEREKTLAQPAAPVEAREAPAKREPKPYPDWFGVDIWPHVAFKVGKADALRECRKAKREGWLPAPEAIIQGYNRYVAQCRSRGQDTPQYLCRWVKGKRWEDEPEPAQSTLGDFAIPTKDYDYSTPPEECISGDDCRGTGYSGATKGRKCSACLRAEIRATREAP